MIQFMGMEEKHIRQMAVLLAKRQERERKAFPYLPARFEEIDEAEGVIRKMLERPYVGGIVAVRGIDVIGYLLYEFKESAERGRYVWMGYESIAVSEHEHPRLVRLLYADAGAEWVKNGYFHHALMVPLAEQKLLNEWLEQSFYFEQKYALLPLEKYEAKQVAPQPPLKIRRGTEADVQLYKKMALWNSIHQTAAPSWNPITKETMEEVKKDYEELSEEENSYVWIAEQGEQVAGFHVYYKDGDPYNLVMPEKCIELPAASTNPDLRGRGVGRTMADHCFAELQKDGFEYIFADWRTANHLASYFWPRLGFEPVMVRMSRQIDPRIAWAHGR